MGYCKIAIRITYNDARNYPLCNEGIYEVVGKVMIYVNLAIAGGCSYKQLPVAE